MTTLSKEWKYEFDRKFGDVDHDWSSAWKIGPNNRDDLKSFIENLLSQREGELREKFMKLNVGKLSKAKALGLQFHGKRKLAAFMDGFRTARNNLQEQKVALLSPNEGK